MREEVGFSLARRLGNTIFVFIFIAPHPDAGFERYAEYRRLQWGSASVTHIVIFLNSPTIFYVVSLFRLLHITIYECQRSPEPRGDI